MYVKKAQIRTVQGRILVCMIELPERICLCSSASDFAIQKLVQEFGFFDRNISSGFDFFSGLMNGLLVL